MDKFEFHASLLVTALFCAGAANADDTKIEELLDANSHPVILGDDGISGPGANLIIRLAEGADAYPKALMKFGSWHLYEGLSPTLIHTIGDFFASVARFNGFEFLSINFVSLPEDPEEFAGEDWLEEYKEDFIRLVYSYDLLFFVGTTRPATFTVVPQPD